MRGQLNDSFLLYYHICIITLDFHWNKRKCISSQDNFLGCNSLYKGLLHRKCINPIILFANLIQFVYEKYILYLCSVLRMLSHYIFVLREKKFLLITTSNSTIIALSFLFRYRQSQYLCIEETM